MRVVTFLILIIEGFAARRFEVIDTPSVLYIVMDLASGGELFDYIVAHGRVDEVRSRQFFHEICSAVEHCHTKGIVHRDIKVSVHIPHLRNTL